MRNKAKMHKNEKQSIYQVKQEIPPIIHSTISPAQLKMEQIHNQESNQIRKMHILVTLGGIEPGGGKHPMG